MVKATEIRTPQRDDKGDKKPSAEKATRYYIAVAVVEVEAFLV